MLDRVRFPASGHPGTGFWVKMLEKTSRVVYANIQLLIKFGIKYQIEFDKLNKLQLRKLRVEFLRIIDQIAFENKCLASSPCILCLVISEF